VNIDDLISTLQTRLSANNRRQAKIIVSATVGCLVLAAALFSIFSKWGSAALLTTGLAAILILIRRMNLWRPVSSLECSAILDRFFQTKERAVSYLKLQGGPDLEAVSNKRELIEQQLNRLIDPSKIDEITRFQWSRALKITACTGALAWVAALAVLIIYGGFGGKLLYRTKEAQLIAELLEKEPELPKPLREDLNQLALKIETLGLSALEVKEALAAAQDELSKSQSRLAEEAMTLDQNSTEQAPTSADKPEEKKNPATPPFPEKLPPTPPSPPAEQELKQNAKQDTQSSSQAPQQQSTENEKASSQDAKSGAKRSGQEQQEKGEQGLGQGSGQAEGSQSKEGAREGQQGGWGDSGSAQDTGKNGRDTASAPGLDQEGRSKEGKELKKESKEKGIAKEDSANNKALDKKTAGLKKVEETLAQIEQEMQAAHQNQGSTGRYEQPAERSGESSQDNEAKNDSQSQQAEDNRREEQKQKQGRQEQGADSQSKPTRAKNNNEPSGSVEKSSKGAQQAQEKATADKKSEKEATGASLPPDPNAPMRPISEGELGQKGPGVGPDKEFKDAEIKAEDEKFDTRFTGQDAGLAGNEKEAKVKTELADIKLAKPEAPKDKAKQPIPLEYRDLLK